MEEKKQVKKVAKGKVVRRKKKAPSNIEKSMKTAWRYICTDVLAPALRDMLFESVTSGAQHIIYQSDEGVYGRPVARGRSVGNHRTNYNKVSPRSAARPEPERRVSRTSVQVDDIIVSSREDGEEILATLRAEAEQYEVARVSSLYSMAGITPTFTDEKWGWYDLRGAALRRVRDGFLLILPEPEAIL